MAGLAIRRRMERREAVVVVKQRAEPVRPRIARAVLVPLHDAGYVGDRRAGEPGVVELTSLIGYLVMVSMVLNVTHTPEEPNPAVVPLAPFPL